MGFIRSAKLPNYRLLSTLALLAILLLTPRLPAQGRKRAQGEPRFDRVVIESLDPDAWNGVVFMANAYQQQISFALRVGSRRDNFLDGAKIFSAGTFGVRPITRFTRASIATGSIRWRSNTPGKITTFLWMIGGSTSTTTSSISM